jgi:hypothetical protein
MSEFIEFNTYQEELKRCTKCNRRIARFKDIDGKCYCTQCADKDPTLFGKCYYGNNREDLYTIARHECRDSTAKGEELLDYRQEIRYCDPKKFFRYHCELPERGWYIVEHKFDWDWGSEWDEGILEVNYCPFCGKKLEVLNENRDSKRNVENSPNKIE